MNANDSVMCGYISTEHIDFILTVKLCYFIQIYTEYEKDEKIVLEKFEIKIFIYRYILKRWWWKIYFVLSLISIENLKTISYKFDKTLVPSIISDKCGSNDKKNLWRAKKVRY